MGCGQGCLAYVKPILYPTYLENNNGAQNEGYCDDRFYDAGMKFILFRIMFKNLIRYILISIVFSLFVMVNTAPGKIFPSSSTFLRINVPRF